MLGPDAISALFILRAGVTGDSAGYLAVMGFGQFWTPATAQCALDDLMNVAYQIPLEQVHGAISPRMSGRADDSVVGDLMQSVDFAQLVTRVGDAIVVSDPNGAITVWNHAAERIFGFSETEALGQSLDLITPERHRQRHWSGYEKTMRTGETRYGSDVLRVPALHKDGRALSIAFTVGLLFDAENNVTGIAAVIRDETRSWNEERQMRRRLAELEAEVASARATQEASASD